MMASVSADGHEDHSLGAAVGGIGSALIGSSAAKNSANIQADSVDKANAIQKEQYDQTRADQTPYREAGYSALDQIQNLLKNPDDVTKQPGYQFGMDQGTRAVNSGAASRGMTYSGAAGKELTRFGQDYGGTKLNESYNRLANVAGLGQVAVSGQNNQNYAGNVGNNTIGAGNARAGSSMYQGQQWGNTVNQLGAMGSRYMNTGGSSPYLGQGTNFYGGSGTTLYGDGYGPG